MLQAKDAFPGTPVVLMPVCLVDSSVTKFICWGTGLGVVIVLGSGLFWVDAEGVDGWRQGLRFPCHGLPAALVPIRLALAAIASLRCSELGSRLVPVFRWGVSWASVEGIGGMPWGETLPCRGILGDGITVSNVSMPPDLPTEKLLVSRDGGHTLVVCIVSDARTGEAGGLGPGPIPAQGCRAYGHGLRDRGLVAWSAAAVHRPEIRSKEDWRHRLHPYGNVLQRPFVLPFPSPLSRPGRRGDCNHRLLSAPNPIASPLCALYGRRLAVPRPATTRLPAASCPDARIEEADSIGPGPIPACSRRACDHGLRGHGMASLCPGHLPIGSGLDLCASR